MLADLEALQSSAPKKSLLQELDEVARAVPKAQDRKVAPAKPWQDELFKKIEEEKKPKNPIKSKPTIKQKERELIEPLKESNEVERSISIYVSISAELFFHAFSTP